MAEVLSQSQIDELLKSMAMGVAADEDSVEAKEDSEAVDNWKKYDFGSPKKFAKDRLKMLKGIYDNFSRIASLKLNAVLRSSCEVEVITIEEQRYFEFNNMLNEKDVIMLQHINVYGVRKAYPIIFHMSTNLMVSMIDRTLGGTGESNGDVDLSYEYTDIELALFDKVMGYTISATESAWSNHIDLKLADRKREENSGLFQDINLDEAVVIILLEIKTTAENGSLTICIPGSVLIDIFESIDQRKLEGGILDDGGYAKKNLLMGLNKVAIELKAELGVATINLEDVYKLKVGDVIEMNKEKDSDVTVYVEEKPWFEGQLGTYNKNTAVQIKRRVAEEETVAE